MKEKYLKIIIYFIGALAVYAFIAVRYPSLLNVMLKEKVIPEYWENVKYGELYYFNYITHFRENMPEGDVKYRFKPKHPDLNSADILTFGDSFFDFTRMTTFPEQLGDTLNKKVFYAREAFPLRVLAENNYHSEQSRILIYETAERYIHFRFSKPHAGYKKSDNRNDIRKKVADVRDMVFLKDSEIRYGLLLNRSYLTKDIYSFINTFKFDIFGYIPATTPVYSLNHKDPWLFYFEEVDNSETSFYYRHSDMELETYCDNIADLHAQLKQKYNIDMIFMPLPSKYTIYHKLINNDSYNNFLPRLYQGLAERKIPVVNVYDAYINSEEILYYGTDTHWNNKGLEIALEKTLDILENEKKDYLALDYVDKTTQQEK